MARLFANTNLHELHNSQDESVNARRAQMLAFIQSQLELDSDYGSEDEIANLADLDEEVLQPVPKEFLDALPV